MSVDLDEYYVNRPITEWDNYEDRSTKYTRILLDLFEKYHVKATFFILGYIAKRNPELIKEVVEKGHEIASHGYSHREVHTMTINEFEDDLKKSSDIIQKVSGEKPLGFRAPRFSINRNTLWAFKVLKKYFDYDSSIFPISHVKYGSPEAPRKAYKLSTSNPLVEDVNGDFVEIPLATLHLPLYGNFPIAGGFYLRLLPIQLIKYGIQKLNDEEIPAMFYIHAHDLDPFKPHVEGYKWTAYWNLKGAQKKLEFLLKNFQFSSTREVVMNK